jgi:phage-related protein
MKKYGIVFYIDQRGVAPVYEYIRNLGLKSGKGSRVKYNKTNEYIEVLSSLGTMAGEPFLKHIDGGIWELRPLSDRIFFAAFDKGQFILLHHFAKKTQKTPRREIDTAKRRLDEARKERDIYE